MTVFKKQEGRATISASQTWVRCYADHATIEQRGGYQSVLVEPFSEENIRHDFIGENVKLTDMLVLFDSFLEAVKGQMQPGKGLQCGLIFKGKTPRGAKSHKFSKLLEPTSA